MGHPSISYASDYNTKCYHESSLAESIFSDKWWDNWSWSPWTVWYPRIRKSQFLRTTNWPLVKSTNMTKSDNVDRHDRCKRVGGHGHRRIRGPIQLKKNPHENPHETQIWKGDMHQLLFPEIFILTFWQEVRVDCHEDFREDFHEDWQIQFNSWMTSIRERADPMDH